MKKISKIALCAAAALGVAGIGLTAGGLAMGATMESVESQSGFVKKTVNHMVRVVDDWDGDSDWDEDDDWDDEEGVAEVDGETASYEFDNITALDIELPYDELILKETDSEKLTVSVTGKDTHLVKVSTEGTELNIEGRGKPKSEVRTVTVSYPEGKEFTEVSIEVDAGYAILESNLNAGEFSASVGAGMLENNGTITARETEIEVGVGAAELMNLDSDYIEAECGVGTLTFDVAGSKTDYAYRISCGVGSVILDEETFTGLGSSKKIDNTGATRRMQLECGMGTIEVDFAQ